MSSSQKRYSREFKLEVVRRVPVTVSEAISVAENVQGSSLGWSEVILDSPAGCQSEGLYLLLRFPAGSDYAADGQGGGSALGYRIDGEGYPGWISADGHDWATFSGGFGFALDPVFVPADQAGLIMKGAQRTGQGSPAVPVSIDAFPNPFNPHTTLRFTLPDPSKVVISVYDVRGAVVKRLTSEKYAAGSHDVKWQGRDKYGRRVASGVYFVKMKVGRTAMTRRVVLVQ